MERIMSRQKAQDEPAKGNFHFTITGEFLTKTARSLWADEEQPEKALNLLRSAFPDMSEEIIFCVLTGKKKLTGHSDGIEIEDDNAETTDCCNSLSIQGTIGRFRDKLDRLEDDYQMATHQTENVPSEFGLITVPRRRTKQQPTLSGEYERYLDGDLSKIPYREGQNFFSRRSRRPDEWDETEEEEEPKEIKPEKFEIITQDTGWLSPEGDFYPCAYQGHNNLASRLGFKEFMLEEKGWVKMQNAEFVWDYMDLGGFRPTQKQIDMIFDFCTAKNIPMPKGLIKEENQ